MYFNNNVSLAGQSTLLKHTDPGIQAFVMSEKVLIPHRYVSQDGDNTPSQVFVPTSSRSPCFCPLPKRVEDTAKHREV